MTESTSNQVEFAGDELLEYRAVEPWAIVAALVGLVAPVSILAPVLWLVPILGVAIACVALAKLRGGHPRSGQTAALVGLALSSFFITMLVAQSVAARVLVAPQERPVADQFFKYLREGRSAKGHLAAPITGVSAADRRGSVVVLPPRPGSPRRIEQVR